MKVGQNFANQLRIAADDASVTSATCREAMRDAAGIIDTQQDALFVQAQLLDRARFTQSLLIGLLLTAVGVGLGFWSLS
jgi:hypothetical protein